MAKHTEKTKSRKACLCGSGEFYSFFGSFLPDGEQRGGCGWTLRCRNDWWRVLGGGHEPCLRFALRQGEQWDTVLHPPVGLSSPLAPLRGGPFLHHWSGAKHPLCGHCAPRAQTGRCGGGLLRYALCRWLRNGLTFMPSGPELPSSGAKTALLPPPHSKPDAKENLVSPELWGPVIESYQCGLFPNRAHIPQSTLGVSPPSHP